MKVSLQVKKEKKKPFFWQWSRPHSNYAVFNMDEVRHQKDSHWLGPLWTNHSHGAWSFRPFGRVRAPICHPPNHHPNKLQVVRGHGTKYPMKGNANLLASDLFTFNWWKGQWQCPPPRPLFEYFRGSVTENFNNNNKTVDIGTVFHPLIEHALGHCQILNLVIYKDRCHELKAVTENRKITIQNSRGRKPLWVRLFFLFLSFFSFHFGWNSM